ncbi:hypothetical protein [Empedobacter stercoris]|uniref:hypothetical protein n=1 Tax=Empedobacter stercoris TaxID=1628248 RepID=UPI001CE05DF9|nr:hypothetical protein [Empedobacter stercoris]MCA4777883.1 hypothetical protein [Empedobacter stercoris]
MYNFAQPTQIYLKNSMKSNRAHIGDSFSIGSNFILLLLFLYTLSSASVFSQIYNLGNTQLHITEGTLISNQISDSLTNYNSSKKNITEKTKIYIVEGTVTKGLSDGNEVEIVKKPQSTLRKDDTKIIHLTNNKLSERKDTRAEIEENFPEKNIRYHTIINAPTENYKFLWSSKYGSSSIIINKKNTLDFFVTINNSNLKISDRYYLNSLKENESNIILTFFLYDYPYPTRPPPMF